MVVLVFALMLGCFVMDFVCFSNGDNCAFAFFSNVSEDLIDEDCSLLLRLGSTGITVLLTDKLLQRVTL